MKRSCALALSLLAVVLTGCSSGPPADAGMVGAVFYTQSNMHFDPARNTLFTTNYQQAGFIPVGTKVTADKVTRSMVRFTDTTTGAVYEFHQRHLGPSEAFLDSWAKHFGPSDPTPEIAKMSDKDNEGIDQGRALVGMTKGGILRALGHPPGHATPNIDASRQWTYWRNKFNKFIVYFNADGVVTSIQD